MSSKYDLCCASATAAAPNSFIISLFIICRGGYCDNWWRHTTASVCCEWLRARSYYCCLRGSRGESQRENVLLTNLIISHFTCAWNPDARLGIALVFIGKLRERFQHHCPFKFQSYRKGSINIYIFCNGIFLCFLMRMFHFISLLSFTIS